MAGHNSQPQNAHLACDPVIFVYLKCTEHLLASQQPIINQSLNREYTTGLQANSAMKRSIQDGRYNNIYSISSNRFGT